LFTSGCQDHEAEFAKLALINTTVSLNPKKRNRKISTIIAKSGLKLW